MIINISVTDKRAKALGAPVIVCGNSGYSIEFTFDDEWTADAEKTARFVYVKDGTLQHTDVVFTGSTVAVPVLYGIRELFVGVFAGDLQTSTPAKIPCEKSIRCDTSTPADLTPGQYEGIMAILSTGVVKSINGITPDENGNVEVCIVATDEKYFDIDYDGIVSLNPIYENELPEKIVFPESINGTIVSGFQNGMFEGNLLIKKIVLPNTVSAIPENFCKEAKNLRVIQNTEHIQSVGASAFYQTRIEKALLPNLKELGGNAFRNCIYLRSVDIGDIEAIPDYAFCWCSNLNLVKGGRNVKTIGAHAFRCALSLKNMPFLSLNKVTNIGDYAYFNCRIQFDWTLLTNCTFSTKNPTPVSDNTDQYWLEAAYSACENALLTTFSQRDTRWRNENFGNTTYTYGNNGCSVICAIHIHSAITNRQYSTPKEFEAELEQVNPDFLALTPSNPDNVATMLGALGYTVTKLVGAITKDSLEQVYAALSDGAYVFCGMSSTSNINGTHAILLYGVNAIGEMMVLDSDSGGHFFDDYCNLDVLTYQIPIQNISGPGTTIYIVKK